MLFSLILATYGRSDEVDRLLGSLMTQEVGLDSFEVIVVDQNDKIDLAPVISKYSNLLCIKHIKSVTKGLSYNRNIGIKAARGQYFCFPDDDCTYYPDTLKKALYHLCKDNVCAVFGAIRDRESGENIIRDWPAKHKKITRSNFFNLYSSITIFARKNNFTFNEDLGAGCYFGSCEDSDYTYNLVKDNKGCFYFSDVEVWHPKIGITQFSKEKNISYGLGFGAFCASHKFDIFILRIYFMALGFHFALAVFSILKGDVTAASRRLDAFLSRLKGFFEYSVK